MTSAPAFVLKKLRQKKVILFSKTVCPECRKVKAMLNSIRLLTPDIFETVEIEKRGDCAQIQSFLWDRTDLNTQTAPLLFVNGVYFGGYDRILGLFQEQRLKDELASKLESVEIKAAALRIAKLEEVIVRMTSLDTTEIRVELRDTNDHQPRDDEITCPQVKWGLDPWEDDGIYEQTQIRSTVDGMFLPRESFDVDGIMKTGSVRKVSVSSIGSSVFRCQIYPML